VRVVVAGSSGFLGTALRDRLARDGHDVVRLVRGSASTPSESAWDPAAGQVDDELIGSADAVVNLAGASLTRWPRTESYKQTILDSRLATTETVAAAIGRTGGTTTLLNASGADAYGTPGEAVCTESTPPRGKTFLSEVVRQWEGATRVASDAGARVVLLRSGAVLHRDGGAVRVMQIPFRLGLGGRVSSGRQWFSWISRDDWVGAVSFLLTRPETAGPTNLVGPQPVTNAELTRALGEVLHRPTVLVAPALPLRLVVGDLADQVLGSLRVVPGVLSDAGYSFQHPDIRSALAAAFNR